MRRALLLLPLAYIARLFGQRTTVGDEQQGSRSPGGFPAIWLRGSKSNGNVAVLVDSVTMTLDPATNVLSAKSGASGPTFVDEETPAGAIDGTNKIFTLSATPNPLASLTLFSGGLFQRRGLANDYTVSGNLMTYNDAPPVGRIHVVNFRK